MVFVNQKKRDKANTGDCLHYNSSALFSKTKDLFTCEIFIANMATKQLNV